MKKPEEKLNNLLPGSLLSRDELGLVSGGAEEPNFPTIGGNIDVCPGWKSNSTSGGNQAKTCHNCSYMSSAECGYSRTF
jgi:hypothetical protein